MGAWTTTCLSFGIIFLIMGIIFLLLKEKGAMLISGFNTLPKAEREKYDKKRISNDMRNSLFIWSGVSLTGAILSHFVSIYCAVVALIVLVILFFTQVHLDTEKAFGKYKKLP